MKHRANIKGGPGVEGHTDHCSFRRGAGSRMRKEPDCRMRFLSEKR